VRKPTAHRQLGTGGDDHLAEQVGWPLVEPEIRILIAPRVGQGVPVGPAARPAEQAARVVALVGSDGGRRRRVPGAVGKGADNPYGYCGYYADMETLGINGVSNGFLYHVRHRVYDPIAGRWLQRDPAGFDDGMNLYENCGGVEYVDRMGVTVRFMEVP
jgi:RHS repeat-associated protein